MQQRTVATLRCRMDLLVFHGYLLRGTGSNVYTASVVEALRRQGHRVHLLCQERRPLDLPWVDAVGTWQDGRLRIDVRREPGRVTVYRPPIGAILPVYVPDRYEGFDARPFPELTDAQLDAYVNRNVAAVREVVEQARLDAALAGHLVMGPVVLARALAGAGVPYAAKIHGSALEYTVKPHPARFLPYARQGLAGARTVLVGSRHTAESLWTALDEPDLPARTRLGPPGVDVDAFAPRSPDDAASALAALRDGPAHGGAPISATDSFSRDGPAAAEALRDLDPRRHRLVAFVGK